MEVDDRLPLPVFQPVVTWDLAVVLVGFAVSVASCMKLAWGKAQPGQQRFLRHRCPITPIFDVINNLIASVVGNPTSF
jgi:hypothetical protein